MLTPSEATRKFRIDKLNFDTGATVTETSEYLTVDPVTFIREGVYNYEDGRAYKPSIELAAAAEVAGDLRIAWDHPRGKVITNHKEVKGFASAIRHEKDSKGDKIKGRMTFLKKRLTQDQIELIRSKSRPDVSLGFYYSEDRTPGSWNGQAYDYVQRDYIFDHVASVDHGRCPYPQCGLGVDAANLSNVKIGNDPYPSEHSCRLKPPGSFQEKSFRRVKHGKVNLIMARQKGESTMTLQAIRYPKSTWTPEEAQVNCKSKGGTFEAASTSDTVMTSKTNDAHLMMDVQKIPALEANLHAAEETSEDKCESCTFYDAWKGQNTCAIIEGQTSPNMLCNEYTSRGGIEAIISAYRGITSTPSKDNALPPEAERLSHEETVRLLRGLKVMDRISLVQTHERMHKDPAFNPESTMHRALVQELTKRKRER